VTGILATTLAFGLIAALVVIGIRIKLPPPDPDWRKHLPPPPPPPSRLELLVSVSYIGAAIALVVATAFQATGLALAFFVAMISLLVTRVVLRTQAIRQSRRELQDHDRGTTDG
jgi:hypothetical protein